MAEDVAAAPATRPEVDKPAASRAERAHSSAYYTRFSLAYTALIMLALAGVGALVLLLVRPAATHPPPWSKFVPTGASLDRERQIATRVSSEYEAAPGSLLVTVFPGPLQAPGVVQGDNGPQSVQVPVSLISVQPDVSTGQHEQGDFTFFQPDTTVGYEMCSFSDSQQNCAAQTPGGADPEQLLRREALELALYTLKYVPGTNAVLTYLPPTSNPQAPTRAVFITRKDVGKSLHVPLSRTLKTRKILLGTSLRVPDDGHVAALTHIYTTSYQTLPSDGTAALTLTPAFAG
ncbi:MAG TPA: hypothetical protein VGK62_04195 [Gaiellaceae bacterium]